MFNTAWKYRIQRKQNEEAWQHQFHQHSPWGQFSFASLFICFVTNTFGQIYFQYYYSLFIFLCLKSCADVKVTNKTLFPTFSRTSLGPPEKISKSVIALLKAYQWNKFVIVADTRQWTKEITLAIKVRTLLNWLSEHRRWIVFPSFRIWQQKITWMWLPFAISATIFEPSMRICKTS